MKYYFTKTVKGELNEVRDKITKALSEQGFGVLTEINIQNIFKKKLSKDIHPYVILGACSPADAFDAIEADDKIGTMLPCNVVLQQKEEGLIEVTIIDTVASLLAVQNQQVQEVAKRVQVKLEKAMEALK